MTKSKLAAEFYPERARALFENELPTCARCETKINVAWDDYTGLMLCEWCGWEGLENDIQQERLK
ncbi:MAG: hypothetical protein ACOCUC_01865 [bacterium]